MGLYAKGTDGCFTEAMSHLVYEDLQQLHHRQTMLPARTAEVCLQLWVKLPVAQVEQTVQEANPVDRKEEEVNASQ